METKKTAVIRHIGKRGRGKGQFMSPCGVAVTLTGISCVSFRNIFIFIILFSFIWHSLSVEWLWGLQSSNTKVSIIRNMLRVHWTKTNHRNRGIHVFNNALQWNFVIIELIGHFVEIDQLFQLPFSAGQAIMKSTVGWLVYTSSELMIHVCYPGKHNSTLFLQINKQESRVCFLSREHRDRH